MQVGETVQTITVATLEGLCDRLRRNGASGDVEIKLSRHKNAGGWTLSADFEPGGNQAADMRPRVTTPFLSGNLLPLGAADDASAVPA